MDARDFFSYSSQYKIIICRHCCMGVWPEQALSHLKGKQHVCCSEESMRKHWDSRRPASCPQIQARRTAIEEAKGHDKGQLPKAVSLATLFAIFLGAKPLGFSATRSPAGLLHEEPGYCCFHNRKSGQFRGRKHGELMNSYSECRCALRPALRNYFLLSHLGSKTILRRP
jgi:hypothetical protein